MGRLVIVSGEPGSGKTVCCRRLVDEARRRGLVVRGLLTLPLEGPRAPLCDEVRPPSSPRHTDGMRSHAGGRILEDLATGERRLLATRVPSVARSPGDPLWRLSDETLAWGDAVLAAACPADVLVVDEVGPVELLHRRGWHGGLWRALSGRYGLAVVVVRPWLLPRFRRSWAGPIERVVDAAGVDPAAVADELLVGLLGHGGGEVAV